MRRRGRSLQTGAYSPSTWHSTGGPAVYPDTPALVISEVPEAWRTHARESWRILFPDLEWTQPRQDD